MANGDGCLKLTYWAGWIIAIATFAYKAFTFTNAGLAVATAGCSLPVAGDERAPFPDLYCPNGIFIDRKKTQLS
jgi:hypothetical protein